MVEKRKFKRIFFREECLSASFTKPGDGDSFEGLILNMGVGGLGLSMKKLENIDISPGDRLVLSRIIGAVDLSPLSDIVVEVKWAAYLEHLQYIGFGCEFLDLPQDARIRLQNFITAWENING